MNAARQLRLVAPQGCTLAIVLRAALSAHGWTVGVHSPDDRGLSKVDGVVIVVEDDAGRAWTPTPSELGRRPVVIGSIRSLGVLIPLAAQGATVLNQAVPVLVLIGLVEAALSARSDVPFAAPAELLRRQAEATALDRLTQTESQVLARLIDGVAADRIAEQSHHSIHTVRSQIKSILAKLAVSSQLAAVAVAHRSGSSDSRDVARATFTNFGDDRAWRPAEH